MRAILDDGAHDGVVQEFIYDEGHQAKNHHSFAIKHTADVEPNLKENARLRTLNDGYSPSRTMRRVASIPPIVILQWIEKYGVDPTAKGNEQLLWRLLNSSEYAYLRTDSKSSRVFWTSPTTAKQVPVAKPPLVIV